MGFGFKLKKAFSKVFHPENLSFSNIIGVSLVTGMGGMAVGINMAEDPEGRAGAPQAEQAYTQHKNDIAALGKDNTEVITLKRDRVTLAESLSYMNPKDVTVTKDKLNAMEKREAALVVALKDIDKKTYTKIAHDPKIAESDVVDLVNSYQQAMGYELSDDFKKLAFGSAFLNECRAATPVGDTSAVISCASVKATEGFNRATNIQAAAQLGSASLFGVLSFLGSFVRRRVKVEEAEMKDSEVRQSVDGLREMLKPKSPKV